MTLKNNVSMAMVKLLEITGCPDWFQRAIVDSDVNGSPVLVLVTNRCPPDSEMDRIPTTIDDFPIYIVYRDSSKRFLHGD